MREDELFLQSQVIFRMADHSRNTFDEFHVKVKDDAPHEPSESSARRRVARRDHVPNGTLLPKPTRLDDPQWKVNRKTRSKKNDYSWFLEDDFDIDRITEETGFANRKCLLRIAEWVLLVLLLAAFSCTLYVSKLKDRKIWVIPVWKWELLFFVIISGKLVSGWAMRLAISIIESKFHLKISLLYVVYGLRKSIRNVVWLSLVTAAWHFIAAEKSVTDRANHVPRILRKIIVCLLVGTMIWLMKTLIVKILASSFHLRSFFKRIRVSLYKQYVIKKLGGNLDEGDVEETKNVRKPFERRGEKKIIAMKVKRVIEIVQVGDLPCLSSVDEDLPVRSEEGDDDEDESSLRSRDQCVEDLARRIFRRVANESKCITQDDLKYRLGEDKLTKARELFTGAMCKVAITENGFVNWMVDAYRERRTLALSLSDTKTAVDDLHHMMDAIVVIMILVIWLIICGAPVTKFLIFMTTQLVVAVYVFGNTGKMVFESIIFLFIMHPYDVGDRCEVDGTQMVVDEMTILTTVFLRYDSQKIIYPNSVLATKPVGNFSRSPAMGDEIKFSVHISTPQEKINTMKEKIRKYLDKKGDYWFSDAIIIIKNVEDMNRLDMVVWPKHVINHHNMTQRWERRSDLIEKMIRVFRKLEIEYRMLPIEMNVRNIGGAVTDRPLSNWKTCY